MIDSFNHQLLQIYLCNISLFIICAFVIFSIFRLNKNERLPTQASPDLSRKTADSFETQAANFNKEINADLTPQESASDIREIRSLDKQGWLKKLHSGLDRTRQNFVAKIDHLLSKEAAISSETLEKIHEILFRADVGIHTSDKIINSLKSQIDKADHDHLGIKQLLKNICLDLISLEASKPDENQGEGPQVILVVGVNGVGKTTSVGKLAAHYASQGKSVALGAADTFRAAAIEQLKVWGDRLDIKVTAHKEGGDPAAVAFDSVKGAKAKGKDVVIIDTAGRLHNKKDLMQELTKIKKVIQKEIPSAPHQVLLVLDATTGQNALIQTEAFKEAVDIDGIILTKLDGTAKGGVLIGICDRFGIPIKYIGVGEKAADLRTFEADSFIDMLFDSAKSGQQELH